MKEYDVIQFNENHKWQGVLGTVVEKKVFDDDVRYTVSVGIPGRGSAFIYVMESENSMDHIGTAKLILEDFARNDEMER